MDPLETDVAGVKIFPLVLLSHTTGHPTLPKQELLLSVILHPVTLSIAGYHFFARLKEERGSKYIIDLLEILCVFQLEMKAFFF